MAEDAVDEATKELPGEVPASHTDKVPLVGAEGYTALLDRRDRLAERSGLAAERIDQLLGRYGTAVMELLDLIEQQPGSACSRWQDAPNYLKGRSPLRGVPRGRAAPGRHPGPAAAGVDRHLRPRRRRRRRSRANWSHRCWAGTPRPSDARSNTTTPASRPRAIRSSNPTITRPTRRASARPRFARCRLARWGARFAAPARAQRSRIGIHVVSTASTTQRGSTDAAHSHAPASITRAEDQRRTTRDTQPRAHLRLRDVGHSDAAAARLRRRRHRDPAKQQG